MFRDSNILQVTQFTMIKQITSAIKVITLALVISFGLSYVYAWTAPTATPPGGNVSAPINTSGTAQTKTGDFNVQGLFSANIGSFGQLGVGTQTPASGVALDVAGTIKTTSLRLATGAGVGKVLTSVDADGNVGWADAAQATGGTSKLPVELLYRTPGTFDFVVESWMKEIKVDLYSGSGGGGGGYAAGTASTGGTSSFGPAGSPIISATGGTGGTAVGYNYVPGVPGINGTASHPVYSWNSVIQGWPGGAGGSGIYSGGAAGGNGGNGAFSGGTFSVSPGTMKVIVGSGGIGTNSPYGANYGYGSNGLPGVVKLTYIPYDLVNNRVYTSNDTFTVPAGVTTIKVQVWGGGGAGTPGIASNACCGGGSANTGGGGGGSGGYAKSTFAVSSGQTYAIVIGAGGIGATTGYTIIGSPHSNSTTVYRGNPGGTTRFGAGSFLVTATGGTGGKSADYWIDGGSDNGQKLCYGSSAYAAPAGVGTGNLLSIGGAEGTQCNSNNVGAAGGGSYSSGSYSYGAGGSGSSAGGPQFNGGNGAVVVSW